ncbi:MAG: TetR family transcriptional regulator [Paracoccaceae bacterium]|nr:MAG: TetR family transcriptional regulator [Paracoccaceae bacterium]
MTGQEQGGARRTRRKRREEVLDAAARVFAERGYHGASTQDIADLLGMRQASLYYYFRSKEEALEEVCARGTRGFIERAEAILAGDADHPEKLRALLRAQVLPMQGEPDYVRTFLNERKWLPPTSRRRIGALARRIEEIFETVIRDGIASGSFRSDLDARSVTFGLLGMMNSAVAWHRRVDVPLARLAADLAELAVAGLMARAGRPGADDPGGAGSAGDGIL